MQMRTRDFRKDESMGSVNAALSRLSDAMAQGMGQGDGSQFLASLYGPSPRSILIGLALIGLVTLGVSYLNKKRGNR